jgi:hypothetical protein
MIANFSQCQSGIKSYPCINQQQNNNKDDDPDNNHANPFGQ